MRFTKRFAGLALAAGMLLGAGTLSAADRNPVFGGRADVRTAEAAFPSRDVRVEKARLPHRPVKFHHEVSHVRRNLHRRGGPR